MSCPACKSSKTVVVRTRYRKTDGRTVQTRVCRSCGNQFAKAPMLRKRSNAVTAWQSR